MIPECAYRPSRCGTFYTCWIVNNTFRVGPAGWSLDWVEKGNYHITVHKPDVCNMQGENTAAAFASICTAEQPDDTEPKPSGRTFSITSHLDGDFTVLVSDGMGVPIDSDFSLFVSVPD